MCAIMGYTGTDIPREKLREAYFLLNTAVNIEIQTSDSSSGIRSVAGGDCDFGMASRSLNAGERAQGLEEHSIALDGIAVVVHPENTAAGLTSGQVRDIYLGKAVFWRSGEYCGVIPLRRAGTIPFLNSQYLGGYSSDFDCIDTVWRFHIRPHRQSAGRDYGRDF